MPSVLAADSTSAPFFVFLSSFPSRLYSVSTSQLITAENTGLTRWQKKPPTEAYRNQRVLDWSYSQPHRNWSKYPGVEQKFKYNQGSWMKKKKETILQPAWELLLHFNRSFQWRLTCEGTRWARWSKSFLLFANTFFCSISLQTTSWTQRALSFKRLTSIQGCFF